MAISPYLQENRLSEVIAAIQALATYRFYKLDFGGWADRITGDELGAEHWKHVFEEHPEFFRLDSKRSKASLVIRRQHSKRFDVDNLKELSKEDIDQLTDRSRISRSPLSSSDVSSLIQTAIELHSRAITQDERSRWWIPLATAAAGFIGALLGALLSFLSSSGAAPSG